MADPNIDVRYVARLARLALEEGEIAKFEVQLGELLAYARSLATVDVSTVEPTAHASPVFNVFRPDDPRASLSPPEALANAPRQAKGLFIVPKVVE